jgi:phosphoribosylformimino-5-aminoimidazole carboxamide ribotide isomerase
MLADHCSEFLIHAADVEGLCRGIDEELVISLGKWVTIPTTYAGGGKSLSDLALVDELSNGKVDLTIGSALDLFGGTGVHFADCIQWNNS